MQAAGAEGGPLVLVGAGLRIACASRLRVWEGQTFALGSPANSQT